MLPQGADQLTGWHKAAYSDPNQSCVEVGYNTAAHVVGVRDTKNRTAATLVFSGSAWRKFISHAAGHRQER
ncbi:hypothetical protein GCM10010185_28210 [Saccharothrix coeruleofusca]|uniref:DUF397 domain-containing protein n=1 Tax=Saccharothrix coeruleofusca TaxID=33919 RepID=A0A918ALF5_9PSEU|nr:hypothetical protein GCM10010185_28210 [Saccharothrix coeruleofusca]